MKNKIGTALMAVGMLALLAALVLVIINWREDRNADLMVAQIMPQMVEQISDNSLPDPYDPTMTEVMIDGYAYIGYLKIPALSLELPVMSDWDYNRFKIAPCRYYGSVKTDDLVIAAHNYDRHFGKISQMQNGNAVYFVDMEGVTHQYEVAEYEILGSKEVEDMTSGAYDLTLFTCTYGGKSRVTVRCNRVEDKEE